MASSNINSGIVKPQNSIMAYRISIQFIRLIDYIHLFVYQEWQYLSYMAFMEKYFK